MDAPISGAQHEEFRQWVLAEKEKLEDEDGRQNKRLEAIEDDIREFRKLASSVEKLAVNMEAMLKEQEKQGRRLERLEARDGEMWRKTIGYVLTALISGVIGFLLKQVLV